jgi:cryptochrome
MLWREFYYLNAYGTKDFHSMEGNKNCRNIPWGESEKHDKFLEAWKNG